MAGQVWSTNTAGGYLYADDLSDTLRMQVRSNQKFRQLCDAKDFTDKGMGKGQTAHWDVVQKLPDDDARLTEGTAIGQSQFKITQGTATVTEWGREVPFTNLIDMFAKHKITPIVKTVLSRHCRETFDREAHGQFKRAHLTYVATGTAAAEFTINGTATATNDSPLNKHHVKRMVSLAKERDIPGWNGSDDYLMIARPSTYDALSGELEAVSQYTTEGFGRIMNGERGRYEGVRFIEQTAIKAGVANTGTPWGNAKSDEAFLMGEDTVAEVIVLPPEIRGKIPGDYGRSLGMAWYAVEGFKLVYDNTSDPIADGAINSRIIRWASAA